MIVVVAHFSSLQAVTQLERCDQRNIAGEAGEGGGEPSGRIEMEGPARKYKKEKEEELD